MMRLIAVLILVCSPALAEDNGHALHHHGFYENLKQPNGSSCCNNHDCRPAKYRLGYDGTVSMQIGERWIVVPTSRVQELVTPDGDGHWCGTNELSRSPVTYCAIIPKGAS